MKKTAALHNLGCKVNAYETEAMQQMLVEAGFDIVPFTEKADVYVINTCSVTNIADRKSRQMLHRTKKLNPDSILVAAGCYVQTSKEQAMEDEDIDILLGNNRKHRLIELVGEALKEKKKTDAVIDIAKDKDYETLYLSATGEHTRAFIKVQDGCNQFCSYCIIPYARGRVRSRQMSDVINEVTGLAQKGFKEIVLTGIHLSSYGVDMKKEDPTCTTGLLTLIQEVSKIEGIERIRLGSLEPGIITREFLEGIKNVPEMCPHFHLSLQSGSTSVLKRMNRKYTAEEYKAGCDLIREYFEHPAITTDVIVGFPGETKEEFEETKAFIKEIGFYEVHLFKYSRRKGTVADKMPDQIPEDVKTKRSHELAEIVASLKKEFMEYYLEKEVTILTEETEKIKDTEYMTGYTKEYVKCGIKGEQIRDNAFLTGNVQGFVSEDVMNLIC